MGETVFIAVPYSRPHFGGFVDSLIVAQMPGKVIWQPIYGYSLEAARNWLINSYLQQKPRPDYMLWIDNDCGFHAGAIARLLESGLPMVCGCMYTTDIPPKPTMGRYLGLTSAGRHHYNFGQAAREIVRAARGWLGDEIPEDNRLLFGDHGEYIDIDGCGMHFTLVRRDVIEAISPPYFAYCGDDMGGEDFYFCRKVKEAGFDIAADISVHTSHIVGERPGADMGLRQLLQMMAGRPIETIVMDEWVMP